MAYEATLLLAPLFAALLSGCGPLACKDVENVTESVLLSPDEYAKLLTGKPTVGMTGGAPTTSAPTDTDGGTSSDTAGDTAGSTMTEQEICMLVCNDEFSAYHIISCTSQMLPPYGFISVECVMPGSCEGRRHACVRSHGNAEHSGAAAWLARAAHDEAASVHAFLALGEELFANGAPAELLARIDIAADDERRHAARISDLALRHGGTIPTPAILATPTRDLLALAVENMVEGCVRETWAALANAHQARHAHTLELRDLYTSIAADEANHAELAWSIHAWLIAQLSDAEQAMVAAARHLAICQLHTNLAAGDDEPELLTLGVPDRTTALRLLAGLDAALWSQAA